MEQPSLRNLCSIENQNNMYHFANVDFHEVFNSFVEAEFDLKAQKYWKYDLTDALKCD